MRLIFTLIVLYSMLMLTACPSSASLQNAQAQSSKVAKYANAGVNLTRNLFEGNIITLAQKDTIAKDFVLLAQGGIAFDTAVAKAIQVYGSNAPQNEIQKLFTTFDSEVIGKFLNILKSLGVSAVASKYAAIIDTIRAAVLVVANVFGQKASVAGRLASV